MLAEKKKMLKKSTLLSLIFVLVFIVGYVFGVVYLYQQMKLMEKERARLEAEIELLEAENAYLRAKVQELRLQQLEVLKRMERWLDTWEVEVWEATAYAPLDPAAVEGMCYSDDPNITASGAPVVIGETAAAGPSVPFGTRVWIENIGFRVITDRGGRIGDGNIDVAVETREEALNWGRKTVKVAWQK